METRTIGLIIGLAFVAVAFSGCFGGSGDDDATPYEGQTVEYTLKVRQMMHHAAPDVMLMSWAFGLDGDESSYGVPGPTLEAREGDTLSVTFINDAVVTGNHTIHWHGLHVPWEMDGVPYVTQPPIQPGETFTYEFELTQSGSYWYHCHVDSAHHIDMGMYGALIVHPADPKQDPPADKDVTLILDDWDSKHFHQQGAGTDPEMLVNSTQDPSGDPLNLIDRQVQSGRDFYNNPPDPLDSPTAQKRSWYPETHPVWQPDYDSFTINGKSFPWTEPVCANEGETVRLRLINVGNTWSSMHWHGHHALVTHRDGYLLESPFHVDTLSIGPGERYDVYIELDNPGIWMIHDHNNLAAMNHHIAPGGRDTMLVYEDFDPSYASPVQEMPPCGGAGAHGGHGGFGGMWSKIGFGKGARTGDFLLFR